MMAETSVTPAEQEFLDEVFDRALARLEEGMTVLADELLDGQEHLREQVQRPVQLAHESTFSPAVCGVHDDGDDVREECDNCDAAPNPLQEDTDLDGAGDAYDNCPTLPNPPQEDADNDAIGDACDDCIGPVASWRAEGDATDSANDHDGTPANGLTYTSGVCDQAFNVAGGNRYVEVPEASDIDFQPGSSYSIVMWARRTGTQIPQHFIGKRNEECTGGKCDFVQVLIPTADEIGAVPLNEWVMVAQSVDGPANNHLDLVVDGVVVRELPFTCPTAQNDAPWRIGTSGTCGNFGEHFEGQLDEVLILNRALSLAEIQRFYDHPCPLAAGYGCRRHLRPLRQLPGHCQSISGGCRRRRRRRCL